MCFNWIDKTGWQCTDGYIKKDHPLSGNIKRIIVKDVVAILFHRSNTPQCVMAGQSMDDLKNIDIQQDGHDLIIGMQGDRAVRDRLSGLDGGSYPGARVARLRHGGAEQARNAGHRLYRRHA